MNNGFDEVLKYKTNIIEIDKIKRALCFIIFNEVNKNRMLDEKYDNKEFHKCSNLYNYDVVYNEIALSSFTLRLYEYAVEYFDKSIGYFYYLSSNEISIYFLAYRNTRFGIQNHYEELLKDSWKKELNSEESLLLNKIIKEYAECNGLSLNDMFSNYIGEENDNT